MIAGSDARSDREESPDTVVRHVGCLRTPKDVRGITDGTHDMGNAPGNARGA